MGYSIDYKGKTYNLEAFTMKLAAGLDGFDRNMKAATNFSDKLENALYGIVLALGCEQAKDALGDLANTDVNDMYILFEQIKEAYNAPLNQYKAKGISDAISGLKDVLAKRGKTPAIELSKSDKLNTDVT
jgi:hypothetical protein